MQTMHIRIAVVVVFLGLLGAIVYMKAQGREKPDGQESPKPVQAAPVAAIAPAKAALPTLLDFGRGQCVMCKEMKPILEELQKELAGKVIVRMVDTGDDPQEADKYRIELIPTQVFLDAGGKEVFRNVGFMPKADILAKLREMGVK